MSNSQWRYRIDAFRFFYVRLERFMNAARILFLAAVPTFGQWINHPSSNIPRTADGKADLSAPAPRGLDGKPDLSGIWNANFNPRIPPGVVLSSSTLPGFDLQAWRTAAAPIPMTPWGEAIFSERTRNFTRDMPSAHCLPHGIPEGMMLDTFKIMHSAGTLLVLFEEGPRFRQIFTDGRSHPQEMNPAWFGYSVGKWEGDTLVVDTRGLNDRSWLDPAGHPHSDRLRIIERFQRKNLGQMDVELTFEDPVAYREPWSATLRFELDPDTELIENVCENERDREHLVGRTPSDDAAKISLPIETLRQYAGTYGNGPTLEIVLTQSGLVMAGMLLTPKSETQFSTNSGVVTFVKDSQGRVEKVVGEFVGGEMFEIRRKR
jgi:hypothetical protein